jgi:hypothetical protein
MLLCTYSILLPLNQTISRVHAVGSADQCDSQAPPEHSWVAVYRLALFSDRTCSRCTLQAKPPTVTDSSSAAELCLLSIPYLFPVPSPSLVYYALINMGLPKGDMWRRVNKVDGFSLQC